jgi:hypothetical protein
MFLPSRKPTITRAQQLSARPYALVEPEIRETEGGGAQLKVKLKPSGVHRWLLRFPEGAVKTFELDAIGLFVWRACDGKTTVEELIRKVAERLKITNREAEVATLTFVRMLVKKGLLGVEVGKKS